MLPGLASELAIDGGEPVRSSFLPYGRQSISDDDIEAVRAVLKSDFLTTGPAVASFEKSLTVGIGVEHAVAVSSGTAALHAMYAAAGIGPGDEVIVPIITFAATANAALYVGARPVFADVNPATLLIDPSSVSELITDSTKAIVGVDFAGQPAEYESLYDLASGRDIAVMADAAHSLGSTRDGVQGGKIADASILSFHPVKHVAAGEGGAIVTDDAGLAEKAARFRNHGISADHSQRTSLNTWEYEIADLGFNYRMSDIHCALGESQLSGLTDNVASRQRIAGVYDAEFEGLDGVTPLITDSRNSNAYHLYIVKIDASVFSADRAQFFAALRAENIGVNVHYIPVGRHPIYVELGYDRAMCPNGESAYEEIITLPLWPKMIDQDVTDVVDAVSKVARAYSR
jgi:perosamine synthetase